MLTIRRMAVCTTFARLPQPPQGRRAARAAAAALGRAMAMLLLALLGLGLLGGLLASAYFALQPDQQLRVNVQAASLLALGGVLAALYAAWVFAARRKRLVLFLRRFGQSSANDAISGAMYGSLGARARLVVLDDSVFRPISIPAGQRALILVSALPALMVLALVASLGATVSGPVRIEGAGLSVTQQGFISVGPRAAAGTDLTAYADGPALLQFPQAIVLWLVLAGLGFVAWRAFSGAWEARRRIDSALDLDRLVQRMRRLTRRTRAPKALGTVATVASSSDAMWQQAVARLADEAERIVLDVSFPTAPILWELRLCVERHPGKLLLVMNAAENYRLAKLAVDEAALAALVQRSAHRGILSYDPGDRAARRALHRDLQAFADA